MIHEHNINNYLIKNENNFLNKLFIQSFIYSNYNYYYLNKIFPSILLMFMIILIEKKLHSVQCQWKKIYINKKNINFGVFSFILYAFNRKWEMKKIYKYITWKKNHRKWDLQEKKK